MSDTGSFSHCHRSLSHCDLDYAVELDSITCAAKGFLLLLTWLRANHGQGSYYKEGN